MPLLPCCANNPLLFFGSVLTVLLAQADVDFSKYPNVARWLRHVKSISDDVRSTWH